MDPRPIILAWDNFTPPSRAPWGGQAIARRWKADLALAPEKRASPAIGESWELSIDPALPSHVAWPEALAGRLLSDVLAADPIGWLGAAGRAGEVGTPLLLKILDAAQTLSVQVHPADDDPHLGPCESGKPEGWVILDAAPGAGIWLGLADGVTRAAFEAALDAGADLSPLLHFVPVRPGDAFVIGPGTVHAIGAGVTLLEPQLVRPGKTGVTYRLWDWNRRYDPAGRADPTGQPRSLHRARAVAVTAWDAPRGARYVAEQRREPQLLTAGPGAQRHEILAFDGLTLERWSGHGPLVIPSSDALVGTFVARGRLQLGPHGADVDTVNIRAGQTAVVPAAAFPLAVTLDDAEVYAARVAAPKAAQVG